MVVTLSFNRANRKNTNIEESRENVLDSWQGLRKNIQCGY